MKEPEIIKEIEGVEENIDLSLEEDEPLTPEELKKKKRTKRILTVLFVVFIAAVVSYTAINEFSQKPPDKLGFNMGASNIAYIVVGFCCMFAMIMLETIKYLLMMRSLKVKISFKAAFQTAALGKYYDNVTPSGVGGQPFQIYYFHKFGYSNGISAAMPLTAFFTMQTGFVILSVFLFAINGGVVTNVAIKIPAYIGAAVYAVAPVAIILFTASEKSAMKLIDAILNIGVKIKLVKRPEKTRRSIVKSLKEYRESVLFMFGHKKWLIAALLAISVAYQVAMMSIPYFVLIAFNGSGSYLDMLTMTAFVYCSITLIPTPGNSGAAEGSFYIIFSQLDPSGLFWSMIIWRIACYYSFIAIGLIIYAYNAVESRAERKKEKNEDSG